MLTISKAVRRLFTLSLLVLLSGLAMAQKMEGMASYYADRFHAKPTSTGENYDKAAYTAASKEFPYGTRLEVTNIVSGQTVEVRVNDCGPHHPRRIIDLSRAAAMEIGLLRMGVAKVRLRVLELGTLGPTCNRGAWSKARRARKATKGADSGGPMPNSGAVTPAPSPPAPTVPNAEPPSTAKETTVAKGSTAPPAAAEPAEEFPENAMLFGVQVGSFGNVDNANALLERLREAGFTDAWMAKVGRLNRVFTGKFYFQDAAKELMEKVREAGFQGAAVRRVQ